MVVYCLSNIHETAYLTLEHMDDIFGVGTWQDYGAYMKVNLEYTLYFGPKTMYEYTHFNKNIQPHVNDADFAIGNEQKRVRTPTE